MKKLSVFILSAFLAFSFVGCNDDDDNNGSESKPVISNFSVESEARGGNTITTGGIISFEFDVNMESSDKLSKYHIEIHDEPESGLAADEYKIIDEDFTDIDGLRNTHIHDHIEVPVEASTGNYHFHLTVTSQEGYTATEEAKLEVVENPNAPSVTDLSITNKNGGTTLSLNDVIVVKFTAEAKNGATLKNYHLEIHDEPASGKIEDEYKLVDDEFSDNFKGKDKTTVSHEITITEKASTGKYHFHLHVYDEKNNGTAKTDELNVSK